METVDHLRNLFAYNDWANRRIIAALKRTPSPAALRVANHLLAAEREWLERCHGKTDASSNFWPELSVDECGELARSNAEEFDKLIRRFDEYGLDMRMRYRNSKGSEFENTFRETLTHVLIHSATHRGNIMLKLREEGFEPPTIDNIIYLRETKYA